MCASPCLGWEGGSGRGRADGDDLVDGLAEAELADHFETLLVVGRDAVDVPAEDQDVAFHVGEEPFVGRDDRHGAGPNGGVVAGDVGEVPAAGGGGRCGC